MLLSNYSLFTIFRDLQVRITFTRLQIQKFSCTSLELSFSSDRILVHSRQEAETPRARKHFSASTRSPASAQLRRRASPFLNDLSRLQRKKRLPLRSRELFSEYEYVTSRHGRVSQDKEKPETKRECHCFLKMRLQRAQALVRKKSLPGGMR